MSISNIDRNANVSGSIKTIEFKELENHDAYLLISKNECSLLDPQQIGKHFLVKSTSHPITRGGPSVKGQF